MGLFENRTNTNHKKQVPVWFMRQAGRYHSHYQNIKSKSDFMTMCKDPQLACDVTMGPIEDFHFDAAILFSDLLFPLEHLGMGLNYLKGPPELSFRIQEESDLKKLNQIKKASEFYDFQKQALLKLNKVLPSHVSLLGFVGAPFTLFTYACVGSHSANLASVKKFLYNGVFNQFMEILYPALLENMLIQAQGNPEAICLFDTAAGEVCSKDYIQFIVPWIKKLTAEFKKNYSKTKIIYYSKHTQMEYLLGLEDKNIDVLGVDWRFNLKSTLKTLAQDYTIQGNIDPHWLHLPWNDLKQNLIDLKKDMSEVESLWDKWIFGLGHGVTIETPQENVRNTVAWIHENLIY